MSTSSACESQRESESGAASGKEAVSSSSPPPPSPSPSSPVKTTAWVPKVKQQQQQQQPADDRRASVTGNPVQPAVHDLASDLMIEASGSGNGTIGGKGKMKSKNKKMNWKPLPIPIIRRDPHDRDRDIRATNTRKYGYSGGPVVGGGGPSAGKRGTSNGATANGFRNSAPAMSHASAAGPAVARSVSNVVSNNSSGGGDNNNILLTHSHSHPSNNSHNSNHQHFNSAQSNSSDDSKINRSSSVSSSSSSRNRSHHPSHHHHQQQYHHHPAMHQTDLLLAPTSPTAAATSSSSSEIASSSHSLAGDDVKLSNNSNNFNPQPNRMANGNRVVSGRPPVVRQSTGQSPPSSPSAMTQHQPMPQPPVQHHHHQHPQQQQQHHHHQHQRKPQSEHQPYYGRRSGPRAPSGSTNGGSGRATPNSLKDFPSPPATGEVQYFTMEYAAINPHHHPHDPMSNQTSGLMSPVLTLPPGTVVLPAPTFANGPAVATSSNLAPFYPPTVLPFAAIPVAAGPGSQATGQTVTAVSTPSGLLPVSAFTMPSLPDPQDLKDKIRVQIEYYFSQENLQRDIFIRKKMDSEGYLPISLIASFHRLQLLTTDVNVIIHSLENSASVQLSENHLKARPRDNPLSWPIASETPTVLSPTSPPSSAHTSPLTNGLSDSSSPVSHAVKSSATVIPTSGPTDSSEMQLQHLKLSDGEDCNGAASTSTGGFKREQKSGAAGTCEEVNLSQQQPTSSSSVAVVDEAAATSVASDATLRPDVPSFVPGQLYAAVVSSNSKE